MGDRTSADLVRVLNALLGMRELVVTNENCVVEVRSRLVSKGAFFRGRLANQPWDFILAMGDDDTDESLFEVLPPSSYSIRVGRAPSKARFCLDSVEGALQLLDRLSARGKPMAARTRTDGTYHRFKKQRDRV